MQGKTFVLAVGVVLAAGLAVTVAYKVQQHGQPAATMSFAKVTGMGNGTAVDEKAVHAALFLEDHLNTALAAGASHETDALRIDSMRATLAKVAGAGNTTGLQTQWLVTWHGATVLVELQLPA